MITTDLADLLAAARAGEAEAREQLVTRHLDTVRAVCGSRLRSPHDVADATQETFVRALARLDQVREPESFGAWLRAIAVRVCADHGRHVLRAVTVADPVGDLATAAPGPSELLLAEEEAAELHATLATLGTRDRQALWLRDAIGLPVAHVAADLGVTEGSARVLLARARKRLRAAYQGVAGVAALGWLRLRGRFTHPAPIDVKVALAAQLTIVAVAVGAAVPRTDAPRVVPPAASVTEVAGADHASAPPVATTVERDRAAAATATPDGGAPSPVADGAGRDEAAPPVVAVGRDEPDGPSTIGVATDDGEGVLASFELWGGPFAEGDDGAEQDEREADDEDRLPLGPIEVVPGGGGGQG